MYLKFTDNEVLLLNDDMIKIENDEILLNDKGRWITIHPNGEENKGKHLFIKDGETPKQAVERVYGKDKKQKVEKDKNANKESLSKWSNQFKDLNYSEKRALLDYFSIDDQDINAYLRKGTFAQWDNKVEERLKMKIENIDSAMQKLPENTELIRIVKKSDVMKLLNVDTLDRSIVGKSFKQKGYTSTSYDEGSSFFAEHKNKDMFVRLDLNVDKNVKGVSMEAALVDGDYDEDDYTSEDVQNEKEILLQRGLTMKIANITKVDGQIIIKCDVSV